MVIGVDVSGSIRRERLPQALDFIANVVDDLEVSAVKTRVALVYFSDNAYQLFDVGQFNSKQDIMYWIKRTPYLGGRTNSAAALRLMVINHFTSLIIVYHATSASAHITCQVLQCHVTASDSHTLLCY